MIHPFYSFEFPCINSFSNRTFSVARQFRRLVYNQHFWFVFPQLLEVMSQFHGTYFSNRCILLIRRTVTGKNAVRHTSHIRRIFLFIQILNNVACFYLESPGFFPVSSHGIYPCSRSHVAFLLLMWQIWHSCSLLTVSGYSRSR